MDLDLPVQLVPAHMTTTFAGVTDSSQGRFCLTVLHKTIGPQNAVIGLSKNAAERAARAVNEAILTFVKDDEEDDELLAELVNAWRSLSNEDRELLRNQEPRLIDALTAILSR